MHSSIHASGSSLYTSQQITDYLNTFSIIPQKTFAFIEFRGSFTFSNATTINNNAFFGSANTTTTTGTNA